MFGTQHLTLFIVSGLLLNITPGPDSLFVINKSASGGWRAGSIAALGIGSGVFVHVLAAALGLSALLATSATAFTLVKYAGALYLLYVGISMLKSRAPAPDGARVGELRVESSRQIFLQGFLTNVLNPKVAMFFLAFVPQFIALDASNKPLAFIVLGCIFNFNGMLWCHGLALFTDLARHKLQGGNRLGLWLNRLMGGVFVSFGVKLALSDRS